ncbi:two-component response regulator [Roseovarius nubinhibens ISM]|uniref:Two-component response regulator n=3 Tax=Roseobacteraceae TaxID=2854170 RepID=A3SJP6_ROSNI|nr:two-component response regulator [Roseovarius nubinhibens ISM]HAR52334.1 response regulator [Roseovarius nubinhibens]
MTAQRFKKILHAEDDPDIREIARMSLEMIGGFEILQCASGEEVLKAANDFAPDMFLMDVMMPGMDGRESVRQLRQSANFAETPVVFVTAKASNVDVDQLKEEFEAAVITKPFDPITLPDQLKEIWSRMTPEPAGS